MDTKTEELIAIGASVAANCVPCLGYHLEKAVNAGAHSADIDAAIRIGRMVRQGAAATWDREARALRAAEPALPKRCRSR